MLKGILGLFLLGAVSSCTMACAPSIPTNPNQVAANRPLPPTDPNQTVLQIMQQKSLDKAIRILEIGEKCREEREFTCDELIIIYRNKCGGQLKPVKDVYYPASFMEEMS